MTKWLSWSVEGLLSTGPTLSSFNIALGLQWSSSTSKSGFEIKVLTFKQVQEKIAFTVNGFSHKSELTEILPTSKKPRMVQCGVSNDLQCRSMQCRCWLDILMALFTPFSEVQGAVLPSALQCSWKGYTPVHLDTEPKCSTWFYSEV